MTPAQSLRALRRRQKIEERFVAFQKRFYSDGTPIPLNNLQPEEQEALLATDITSRILSPTERYEFRVRMEMIVPIVAASAEEAAEVLNAMGAETMLAVSERLEVEMEERK